QRAGDVRRRVDDREGGRVGARGTEESTAFPFMGPFRLDSGGIEGFFHRHSRAPLPAMGRGGKGVIALTAPICRHAGLDPASRFFPSSKEKAGPRIKSALIPFASVDALSIVIASEAKQSRAVYACSGLLRFARNDGYGC